MVSPNPYHFESSTRTVSKTDRVRTRTIRLGSLMEYPIHRLDLLNLLQSATLHPGVKHPWNGAGWST